MPECIEAVRAGRDDPPDAEPIQGRDVLAGERLEEELLTDPPGRVAGAGLVATQSGKFHSGLVEELDEGADHTLVSLRQRPPAADPEQHVDRAGFGDMRHRDRQPFRPIDPRVAAPGERMAPRFERGDSILHRGRELGLFHHQVPAQVDDPGHRLDHDRTRVHTRRTRRAGPQGLGRQCGCGVDDRRRTVRALVREPAQVQDQVARR
jgi:hypothetical protein